MAFVDEVGYYAGATSGKTSEISKFLTNGVQWVISMIEKSNPDMLPLFASEQVLSNSPTTLTLSTNSKIIDVVRISADSSGEALKCSPINSAYRSNAVNTDSIYYASKNSPVYYISNAVLTVLPTPTATQTATISIVLPDASVAHTESAISNFPSEMYHGVILYAAVQLLHNKMASLNASLPTDLDSDTTVFDALADFSADIALSSSLPTAINMGSTGLPTAITVNSSLPSPIAISSSLPSGMTVSSSLPSTIAVGTGLPSAIDVSSIGIPSAFSLSTSIPTIAMPDISADFQDAMDKAKNMIDDTAGGTGTSSSAQTWLADEDEEMSRATVEVASQELQRAASVLGKWQQDISKAQTGFQADLQKHQEELTKETSRIQADTARFTTLLGKESSRTQTELAKYSAEMQKESQRVQSDLASYSAEITKEGQRTQIDTSIYTSEVQKEGQRIQAETSLYTTELGLKSTQMQQEVSEYTNLLGKESARIQQESGNYSAELQKESARVQNEMAKYSTNLQKKITLYTTIISKLSADYQWLQGQYQVVKQELTEFMTPYTTSGALDSTAEGVRR